MFHKGEKEKCFAYSANTACDINGYVLGTHVVPGNEHDSKSFYGLWEKLMELEKFDLTTYVAMDAGYITPHICKTVVDANKTAVIPYKRPMTKKGFFKKYEFVYDEKYDCYICPNNEILNYVTTTREGYRTYKSDSRKCKSCPNLYKCTESNNHVKLVTRHIWESYKEEMSEHFRHTDKWKEVYPKRKETIERVFADAKSKHGIGFTRYIGKKRVTDDLLLLFAAMNIKKMVNHLDRTR